ncbi:MAG: sirohydrochlorin chelatase [Candidatus Hodgkinia cicadicola]
MYPFGVSNNRNYFPPKVITPKTYSLYVFFIGHGSMNPSTSAEFIYIVDLFRRFHPTVNVGFWLIEFGRSLLSTSFKPKTNVTIVIPLMLFPSQHVKHDVALICNYLQSLNKRNLIVALSTPCACLLSAPIVSAMLRRIVNSSNYHSSSLVIVGRGGDLAANIAAYSVTRLIWEAAGFLWAETCFVGSSFPIFTFVSRSRTKSLIIIPLLLFNGELFQRLSRYFGHNTIANCILSHKEATLTLFARIRRSLNGSGTASCSLCKHRLLCHQFV